MSVQHDAAEAAPASMACRPDYKPGDPDELRDGLLRGWHEHMRRLRGE